MDTYTTALFDALLSGSVSNFNTWVNNFYEDITTFNLDSLIMGAKNQDTNIFAMGQWRRQETILAALPTRHLESGKANRSSQANTNNDLIPRASIEKWRFIKTFDAVHRNGKTNSLPRISHRA